MELTSHLAQLYITLVVIVIDLDALVSNLICLIIDLQDFWLESHYKPSRVLKAYHQSSYYQFIRKATHRRLK